MKKYLYWGIAGLVWTLAVVVGTYGILHEKKTLVAPPVKPAVHINAPAEPAKEVATVKTVYVPVKQVEIYQPEAKKKLNLPKEIQDDTKQAVISAATVEPDEHPQTVTTVLDTDTGQSRTLVQEEPLPWLAVDKHGEVGAYVGYKGGIPTARLEARQGLVQVKALHIGLMASADQPLNGGRVVLSGMVGVWSKW